MSFFSWFFKKNDEPSYKETWFDEKYMKDYMKIKDHFDYDGYSQLRKAHNSYTKTTVTRNAINEKELQRRLAALKNKPKETDQELVVRMLKGDFEKAVGIPFDQFIKTYNEIVENNPEKLI